ncbi:MAG TPA: ATP-binding cassette domain-containing protein [Gemmatimonadales bacterium]|nr:ATP-binding cassette domain-containing protein [Gemmatimonadales bacterium]
MSPGRPALLQARALATTLRPPLGLGGGRGAPGFELKDISFSVAPGATVALLGQNGAGKTTLLRLLAGVYRPQGGVISARGRVGPVIGWTPLFSPELTPREHVRAYGMVAGVPLDVYDVILRAGLDAVARRPVRLLSAGEQARLALAPGLAVPADIYLLDEGLSLCDPAYRAAAIAFLRRRADEGAAVILAGQDLLCARALCSRALLLERGRLIADTDLDTAIAVFTAPSAEAGPTATVVIESVEVQRVLPGAGERIDVRCRVRTGPGAFALLVALKRPGGGAVLFSSRCIFSLEDQGDGSPARTLEVGIPASALPQGPYQIAVAVTDSRGVPLATREDAALTPEPQTPPDGPTPLSPLPDSSISLSTSATSVARSWDFDS